MSSYRDSKNTDAACADEPMDWRLFTEARLAWIYGADHERQRAVQTQADLTAWRNLGRRPAA